LRSHCQCKEPLSAGRKRAFAQAALIKSTVGTTTHFVERIARGGTDAMARHFFLTTPRSTRLSPLLPITKTTMNIRISKSALAAAFIALLAVAAYWYWSPFLAIREMQSAAKANDAETFNTHVDYPRLRESLKGQFSLLMGEQMAKSTDSSDPFAAFGTMLGLAMADKLVDAMVRPETVMRGMQSGRFGRQSSPPVERLMHRRRQQTKARHRSGRTCAREPTSSSRPRTEARNRKTRKWLSFLNAAVLLTGKLRNCGFSP
jgi:hypothetical protein